MNYAATNPPEQKGGDEKSRNNGYDHQYKNEFSGWRNVMNKAKKSPGFPPERLTAMQEAFEAFKKETLRQKSIILDLVEEA